MKKAFLTILAVIAMVGFVCSCDKDKPGPDKPDKPDTPEETDLITIDGNFADWATAANVVSTELDDLYAYPGLLSMKAVADETAILSMSFRKRLPKRAILSSRLLLLSRFL